MTVAVELRLTRLVSFLILNNFAYLECGIRIFRRRKACKKSNQHSPADVCTLRATSCSLAGVTNFELLMLMNAVSAVASIPGLEP